MKRFICLAFLCGMIFFAYGQKSYIQIEDKIGYGKRLTGDVPNGIINDNSTTIGDLLNQLSKKGYELIFQSGVRTNDYPRMYYTLVKDSSTPSYNAVPRMQADPDEEVTEVARYNLQGLPIKATEKGIQIVVYSNYTTKTIIVE